MSTRKPVAKMERLFVAFAQKNGVGRLRALMRWSLFQRKFPLVAEYVAELQKDNEPPVIEVSKVQEALSNWFHTSGDECPKWWMDDEESWFASCHCDPATRIYKILGIGRLK